MGEWIHINLSIHTAIQPSICLSVPPAIKHPPMCPFIHPSSCTLAIYPSIHPPVCTLVRLTIYLYIYWISSYWFCHWFIKAIKELMCELPWFTCCRGLLRLTIMYKTTGTHSLTQLTPQWPSKPLATQQLITGWPDFFCNPDHSLRHPSTRNRSHLRFYHVQIY